MTPAKDRNLMPAEVEFSNLLKTRLPYVLDWYHVDADGTPWMMVSLDVVSDRGVERTWRLDYDGRRLIGGLSPAALNWDDGVRAGEAGIDTSGDPGLNVLVASPQEAASIAAAWFMQRARESGVSGNLEGDAETEGSLHGPRRRP